jgi:hypothetical protein
MTSGDDYYPIMPQTDLEAGFDTEHPIAKDIAEETGLVTGMVDCRDIHVGPYDGAYHAAAVAMKQAFSISVPQELRKTDGTVSEKDNPGSVK